MLGKHLDEVPMRCSLVAAVVYQFGDVFCAASEQAGPRILPPLVCISVAADSGLHAGGSECCHRKMASVGLSAIANSLSASANAL
jgi:hypothetical protein